MQQDKKKDKKELNLSKGVETMTICWWDKQNKARRLTYNSFPISNRGLGTVNKIQLPLTLIPYKKDPFFKGRGRMNQRRLDYPILNINDILSIIKEFKIIAKNNINSFALMDWGAHLNHLSLWIGDLHLTLT